MSMSATYSPEDNKLRLYSMSRLSKELYLKVKAKGFKWAPKQELFVAPSWSPEREDFLIELCGEVDDEDYSPEERSADRAERFDGYRGKRLNEAVNGAERFESGPAVFGHQSAARAERQAERHDRVRTGAVNQWSKAEYWQQRIASVIRHAMFKSSADLRRGRIIRLETELRKMNKSMDDAKRNWRLWNGIAATPDAEEATKKATYLAGGSGSFGFDYKHPRTGKESSLYSHLSSSVDPITGHEAAALYLAGHVEPGLPGSRYDRWAKHYELRLTYEKALLAEEGGMAAEEEMEVGGFIGARQIHKVNRSPATGRVVSVKVMGKHGWKMNKEGTDRLTCLINVNVERLPAGSYRPATPSEMEAFKASVTEQKKAEKASKPKEPSLINPTVEDAIKLQTKWDEARKEAFEKAKAEHRAYGDFKPSEIVQITQAQYSAISKGAYAKAETRTLHVGGKVSRAYSNMYSGSGAEYDKKLGAVVAKVRIAGYSPERLVVLTDKPQKQLPKEVWQ